LDQILASGRIDRRERTLLYEDDACDAPLLCPNCSSALLKAPIEFETALGTIERLILAKQITCGSP
tara:strand:- start:237 stop:434 length:198 start_codon:yes stop_codon:yes gene_type:complete